MAERAQEKPRGSNDEGTFIIPVSKLTRRNLVDVILPRLNGSMRNHVADEIARAILFNLGIQEPDGLTDPLDIRFPGPHV